MRKVYYLATPYNKENVTLVLESGVNGVICPDDMCESTATLSKIEIVPLSQLEVVTLRSADDEAHALQTLLSGKMVLLSSGWEIIPVENLLAGLMGKTNAGELALEVGTPEEAKLAIGILQHGVNIVVVSEGAACHAKSITNLLRNDQAPVELHEAEITEIIPTGMGHRVCVDTINLFQSGQGMLVGNSAAFTFLVNAETEHNEYVASRPFRINAGAVHSYAFLSDDRTCYLEEVGPGAEVLIVNNQGQTSTAIVGRVKVEQRPMLLIKARVGEKSGTVFLQNAETIRLVQTDGKPISVVQLKPGHKILCRLDSAGRHFGIRIAEDIIEA